MKKNSQNIRVGVCVPDGLESLQAFIDLKLGNMVLARLPGSKSAALEMARFCKENKIYVLFSELLRRGSLAAGQVVPHNLLKKEKTLSWDYHNTKDLKDIFNAGGEYLIGRLSLGEVGGILSWPKAYLHKRANGSYTNLPSCKDLRQAKKVYLDLMKQVIGFERSVVGNSHLFGVDSSLTFKYHLQAGLDRLMVEVMPGDFTLMVSAARGATLAYKKKYWGTHIAMGWYGGVKPDDLWLKRWKISFYSCFLAGSETIYSEAGHFSHDMTSKKYRFSSPMMKTVRKTIRQFYRFTQIHTRPSNRPKVRIGFVYGHLDGFPGLWNKYVWGQWKDKWLNGPAEFGWDIIRSSSMDGQWDDTDLQGENDFRGHYPFGQYDIVPIEAPVDVLKCYSCLVFLGWNTMTSQIYSKLKTFVTQGGQLIMSVPHLSTQIRRGEKPTLYRNGKWADLFGVNIQGPATKEVIGVKAINAPSVRSYQVPLRPMMSDPRYIGETHPVKSEIKDASVIYALSDSFFDDRNTVMKKPFLTEKKLGKGSAFLLHTWEYPGHHGIRPFMEHFLNVISTGEQGDIRVIGSGKVHYAVYENKQNNFKLTTIYLLNTDFNVSHCVKLWVKGNVFELSKIQPAEMRIVYFVSNVVLEMEDNCVDLKKVSLNGSSIAFDISSRINQKIGVYHFSPKEMNVQINGISLSCNGRSKQTIKIKKHIDDQNKQFFEMDYHAEPEMKWTPGDLPY